MRVWLWVSAIFFLQVSPLIARADLSEAQCREALGDSDYDCGTYANDFSNDQGDFPLCWAYSASRYYLEHLCTESLSSDDLVQRCRIEKGYQGSKNDNSPCTKAVSPYSAFQCLNTSVKKGGNPADAVTCLSNKGACYQISFLDEASLRGLKFASQDFSRNFRSYICDSKPPDISDPIQVSMRNTFRALRLQFTDEEILDYFKENPSFNRTIRKLTEAACEKTRIKAKSPLKITSVYKRTWPLRGAGNLILPRLRSSDTESSMKQLSTLVKELSLGHTAIVDICAEPFQGKKVEDLATNDFSPWKKCGAHSVLVNGARWNSKESRCEVRILNSWGIDANLNGWVPFEPISRTMYEVWGRAPNI